MSDKMNEMEQEMVGQMSSAAKPKEIEMQSNGKPSGLSHTYGAGQLLSIGRHVANKMRDPYAQLEMMPTRLRLVQRLRSAGIYRNHLGGLYANPGCGASGSHNGVLNGIGNNSGMGPSFGAGTTLTFRRPVSHNQEQSQQQQQQQLVLMQQQQQLQQLQQQQLQQLQQMQQQFSGGLQDAGDGDASKFY